MVRLTETTANITLTARPELPITESMRRIHVPEFRERHGVSGDGLLIGVIDTGADKNHPDLAPALQGGRSFVEGEAEDAWDDDHGHGTHGAGTVHWTAPGARLMIARALDRRGRGTWEQITAAFLWLLDQGCDIINMSLGGVGPHTPLSAAIEHAVAANVLVVCSAGNEGPGPDTVGYPASLPWPLAVAAANEEQTDMGQDTIPSFSSRGNQVDITAPGVDVISTLPGGKHGTMSGTSQAAPHIAGVAALLMEQWKRVHGAWPLESQLVARLLYCTRRPPNAGREWDPITGAGIIDLGRVLELPARPDVILDYYINDPFVYANGKAIKLVAPPILHRPPGSADASTMLHIREFQRQGATVDWDPDAISPTGYQRRIRVTWGAAGFSREVT